MKPTITVFTPAYKNESTLAGCVSSILSQTIQPCEIVTVADGDAPSWEQAERLGVTVLGDRMGPNRGLAYSCNIALSHCKSEFFVKVDSDVELMPDWLERCVDHFRGAHQIVGVGGRLIETYCSTIADQWRIYFLPQHYGPHTQSDVLLFGADCVFRTEALRAVDGWDGRYRTNYEDMDISKRLLAAGGCTFYDSEAIAHHYHPNTLDSVLTAFWRYSQPVAEDAGSYASAEAAIPLIATNRWAAAERIALCIKSNLYHLLYPSHQLFSHLCSKDVAYLESKGIDPAPYVAAVDKSPFVPNVSPALLETSRMIYENEHHSRLDDGRRAEVACGTSC